MARQRSGGGADTDRPSGEAANRISHPTASSPVTVEDAVAFLVRVLGAAGSRDAKRPDGYPDALLVAFSARRSLVVALTDVETDTPGDERNWQAIASDVLARLQGHLVVLHGGSDGREATPGFSAAEQDLITALRAGTGG